MDRLARIEARIHSLGELGDLVAALRSMSAARARSAQDAVAGTHSFAAIIDRAIADIVPLAGPPPDTATAAPGAAALVVIGSENGFVGGFNARLADHALALRQGAERLIVLGRRGQATLAERGAAADIALPMTARPTGVGALARQVAARLAGVGTARIVFATHRPGGAFDVADRTVLPLPRADMAATAPATPVLHHLPAPDLLAALAEEYLFAALSHALMESLVAEHAARMRTMDAATRAIGDRLARLRQDERAARQEQTTAELLDVTTGAAAVAADRAAHHPTTGRA